MRCALLIYLEVMHQHWGLLEMLDEWTIVREVDLDLCSGCAEVLRVVLLATVLHTLYRLDDFPSEWGRWETV